MKKYGVYASHSGSKNGAWLIREYSELKDAVREALRLSRCRYNHRVTQATDTFIVGDNTGITLNLQIGREYVRYLVEQYILFDDMIGFISISGGCNGIKHEFITKVGVI